MKLSRYTDYVVCRWYASATMSLSVMQLTRLPSLAIAALTRWIRTEEAIKEIELDIGGRCADADNASLGIMDIICKGSNIYQLPPTTSQVNIHDWATILNGWIDEERIVMETLTGFKRAGADSDSHLPCQRCRSWLG